MSFCRKAFKEFPRCLCFFASVNLRVCFKSRSHFALRDFPFGILNPLILKSLKKYLFQHSAPSIDFLFLLGAPHEDATFFPFLSSPESHGLSEVGPVVTEPASPTLFLLLFPTPRFLAPVHFSSMLLPPILPSLKML